MVRVSEKVSSRGVSSGLHKPAAVLAVDSCPMPPYSAMSTELLSCHRTRSSTRPTELLTLRSAALHKCILSFRHAYGTQQPARQGRLPAISRRDFHLRVDQGQQSTRRPAASRNHQQRSKSDLALAQAWTCLYCIVFVCTLIDCDTLRARCQRKKRPSFVCGSSVGIYSCAVRFTGESKDAPETVLRPKSA